MICLHWNKITFHIGFSFFAAAALIGTLGGSILFLKVFTACIIHEGGHLLVLRRFGQHIRCVNLCGAGITILPSESYGAYWRDILILLAGPIANLAVGTLCLFWGGMAEYGVMHISLGWFNLLPYRCLDGGSILDAILCARECSLEHSRWIENVICLLFSILLLLFLGVCQIRQFSLLAMILYLTALQFLAETKDSI